MTYGSSVGNFREAIFVLGACLLFAAVGCLAMISPDEKNIVVGGSSTVNNSPGSVVGVTSELHVCDYAYQPLGVEEDIECRRMAAEWVCSAI